MRIFRQRGQLRGDIRKLCVFLLQMLQRYCKPWQASCFLHRANELCKRTGEKLDWGIDYRNHRAETHCKNAGVSCFTTPRHLFIDNRSSGFYTAFRTVSSASGRPCKSSEFYSLDDPERQKGVAKRDTLSRLDKIPHGITMRNTFHFILIIAHIYLTNVCEFLLHSCRLVDILK